MSRCFVTRQNDPSRLSRQLRGARAAGTSPPALLASSSVRGREIDGLEADAITGAQLPELPAVGRGDRRRADEAAEARTIRTEDDRHVAGEVDGAEGVGVVVDVRGMRPGVAAVLARPPRRGPSRRMPVREEL